MAQGLFAGMTDYSEQSLSDIADDIRWWIKYCEEIKALFESNIQKVKDDGMWEGTIPLEFQSFCLDIPRICNTYMHDFSMVLDSVEKDCISERDISLMNNIYKTAHENEKRCVEAYKHSGKQGWCRYGEPKFKKIEELYAQGRDFCVTMFDVDNAAGRMEDYMRKEKITVDKSTYIDQSTNFGNNANVTLKGKNSQMGSNMEKEKGGTIWNKFYLPLLITVIGGVIVAIICFYLKIN